MIRTAVMGGGAMGLLIAGKLADSGWPVELWTHTGGQARLIREQGLRLEEWNGEEAGTVRIRAVPFADVPPGFSGMLLVALKQTAITDGLLRELEGKLAPEARLVLFQNGIGHVERFAEALPGRRIAQAVTTEGALRTGETSVRHTGRGETWIGEWRNEAGAESPADHADAIGGRLPLEAAEMLKKAGFSTFASNSIRERMLKKLIINAVINPLTALWRVQNGELPAVPERRAVMEALFRETFDVLRAQGLRGERQELWEDVLRVCAATAGNRSSMLQDVLAGRVTEIDALNGAVCRLAEQAGVAAPWNSAVTALVKAIISPEEGGK